MALHAVWLHSITDIYISECFFFSINRIANDLASHLMVRITAAHCSWVATLDVCAYLASRIKGANRVKDQVSDLSHRGKHKSIRSLHKRVRE